MNLTRVKNNIYQIDINNPDTEIVNNAVHFLEQGKLVAAPTETRYGLLANASDIDALNNLYQTKGRPAFLPTAIFVKSIDAISDYGEMNETARKLAEHFLPGPLTLVLQSKSDLPTPVIHDNKIGIRFSSSPFIQALLNAVDFPITATSANLSGSADCAEVNEIEKIFDNKVSLYIDGGNLDGETSTVIDLSGGEPQFLREGVITKDEILNVLEIK